MSERIPAQVRAGAPLRGGQPGQAPREGAGGAGVEQAGDEHAECVVARVRTDPAATAPAVH